MNKTTAAQDKTDANAAYTPESIQNRRFDPQGGIYFVKKYGKWEMAKYAGNGSWFPITGFYVGCRHWAPAEYETPFDEINKTPVTYENFIKP